MVFSAHEVLSDPARRKEYDMLGGTSHGQESHTMRHNNKYWNNFDSMFNEFSGENMFHFTNGGGSFKQEYHYSQPHKKQQNFFSYQDSFFEVSKIN